LSDRPVAPITTASRTSTPIKTITREIAFIMSVFAREAMELKIGKFKKAFGGLYRSI
jgi:hypothetical protein